MCRPRYTLFVAALAILSTARSPYAQNRPDPSGHWEGSVQLPAMDLAVQIDLAKNAKGELDGAITIPAQRIKGFPLANLKIEGDSITFQMKGGGPGVRQFTGSLADGGTSFAGDFSGTLGTVPFALTRKGDAQLEPPAKNAAIPTALEGTWNGTLDVDGGMQLVLKLANQPDGTSVGSVLNVNEMLEIPIATITKTDDGGFRLEFTAVVASYVATLNREGSALTGTFIQGPLQVPLTFERAPAVAASAKK